MHLASIDDLFTFDATPDALPVEEEVALIRRAQDGDDDAKMTLLVQYGRTLRATVSKFLSRLPYEERFRAEEDTRAEALAAFFRAVEEHDLDRSPRLAGAVVPALRRALADLAVYDAAFDVPERTLSRFYGILRKADGDIDRAREIAPEHGMSRENFDEVRSVVRETCALSHNSGEDEPSEDKIAASPLVNPVYRPFDEVEDRILIDLAFSAVDDDEARICELGYGFSEFEPVPDAEIAHRMGLTRPTVQRKRNKALSKMRDAIGAPEPEQD